MIKKINFKKELRSWGIFLGIFLLMYATGTHTQVAAFTQRIVLSTGIFAISELEDSEKENADYNMKLKSLHDGTILDFNNYKGQVVFINFWASWCAPCIAEMPGIQNLYEQTDTENIKFLMISLDQTEEKARKFIEKKGFTFPTYFPSGYLPEVYKSDAIPTTFVIDKNGKIVAKKVGMANYNKKSFRNFLARLAAES